MSATAASRLGKKDVATKVEQSLGDKPLYFKSVGLFSENYILNHLEKSKEPFILRSWETEPEKEFSELYEWMLSTWSDLGSKFEGMSEAQLEQEWIRPILERLGWKYVVQPDVTRHGRRQIPDYALFEDEATKRRAMGLEGQALFNNCSVVADAKAMLVDLDGKALDNTNPSYQIMQYLTHTNCDWGILTNGRYWRLYSLKSKAKFRSYFEVNIEKFLNGSTREDERFKYFFNFFRKAAFANKNAGGQSFVEVVFNEGEQYALQVEVELKDRAFELVELISSGFAETFKPKSEKDLSELYSFSLQYLFRLIFILNCEGKGLLNISRQSDFYKYSLRSLCMGIREEYQNGQKWSSGSRSYDYVKALFKTLSSGDANVGIHGFGREIFQGDFKKFYEANEVSDIALNELLLKLSCQFDKKKKAWAFIDYQRLSADHMGSIFEGLLEFKLAFKGSKIELVHTSGERKNSGSYYTPDFVVDHIVKETVGPLIQKLDNEEILKLKIADPAMGSAHFLLGAVRFLEESLLSNLNSGDKSLKSLPPNKFRWAALHNCIYGADINPLARELAKFSLWMFTATNEDELESLDDQLYCADSLLDVEGWGARRGSKGFDAIVGNPPYVRIQNIGDHSYVGRLKDVFESASHGNFDLYIPFIELGLSKLVEGGMLGYVIPNKFMTADYGAPIREYLSRNRAVREITDFREHQVFADATTYTCMLFLENKKRKDFTYRQVESIADEKLSIGKPQSIPLPVVEPSWAFSTNGSDLALKKIKLAPKVLTDFAEKIYVGVQTNGDKMYALEVVSKKKQLYVVKSKALDKEFEIEADAVMPLLKGADISRYGCPEASQVVLFPYSIKGDKAESWSEKEFRSKCPKAFKYISNFSSELAKGAKDKSTWWLYRYPKNLTLYSKPKILIQVLSNFGKFCLDPKGEYCFVGGGTAGGNAIALREGETEINLVLLGILNSPIATAHVRSVSSVFRGGYVVYSKATLENLPIPDLTKVEKRTLSSLASKIEKLNECSDVKKAAVLEEQVLEGIFDLYGLNKKEKEGLVRLLESKENESKEAA